jgi:hypothetical protein
MQFEYRAQEAKRGSSSVKKLHISDTLALPLDAVTQAIAFLGRRGTGKSYAATKLAELFYEASAQFVAIDPVGIWWGLRLSEDGKHKGLDLPIFGGLRGDIPLEATGGALLADLIVSRNLSAVLDVSQFESDADKARFAHDFAARFFFLKKASPSAVHIFVEEAQEFIPQNIQKGEEKMLHSWQRMIRLGRNYGIGVSIISQRPQDVNKKALNQAECLLCFQLTGPQERDAVKNWIAEKGLTADLNKVLPALRQGYAHVWSPVWLDINEEVHIAQKWTFSAGTTPVVGAKPVQAIPLETLELEQIRKDMAATVERAKENDPRELKRKISELQQQLKRQTPIIDDKATERAVQQAVSSVERQYREQVLKLTSQISRMQTAFSTIKNQAGAFTDIDIPLAKIELPPSPQPMARNVVYTQPQRVIRPASGTGDESLSKAERSIMIVLAQYPDGRSKTQIAILAGYAHTSGSFRNSLSSLRTKGYLAGDNDATMRATDSGLAALGTYDPLPVGQELAEYWKGQLGKAERAIFEVLYESHPRAVSQQQVAVLTGYEATSGSFRNSISKLRTLELISGKGELKASDDLFD